jgi:hypothetical protein
MWRQLFEPHHPNVTTPDLSRMSGREGQGQFRPHVDAEQL